MPVSFITSTCSCLSGFVMNSFLYGSQSKIKFWFYGSRLGFGLFKSPLQIWHANGKARALISNPVGDEAKPLL